MGRTTFVPQGGKVFATTHADQPGVDMASARELFGYADSGKLARVLAQLDQLGLADQLSGARDLLAQASEMRQSATGPAAAARDERVALPLRVADGEITLEQAVVRAAELREWLPDGDAHSLADAAAEALTGRAVAAAKREAPGVLPRLAKLADTAVSEAVDAGRRIVGDATAERLLREYAGGSRPSLFDTDVTKLDHSSVGAWAAASFASERFEQIIAVARELHSGSVATTARVGTRDQVGMLDRVPRCLQLAVAANSQWQPGLHIDGKPVAAMEDEGLIRRMQRSLTGK